MIGVKEFTIQEAVPEGSSRIYSATLTDQTGTTLATSAVGTLTMTLQNVTTGNTINSRSAVNVKNLNGGTLTDGSFEMLLSATDNIIVGTRDLEQHRMILKMTYTDSDGNAGVENRNVYFWVRNLTL